MIQLFIFLLPEDLYRLPPPNEQVNFLPWLEASLMDKYFSQDVPDFHLVAEREKFPEESNVIPDNPELVKDDLLVRTQDFLTVWNYPVKGFVINPYPYIVKGYYVLPDGTLFKPKDLYKTKGAEKWLLALNYDPKNFVHWDIEKAWFLFFESLKTASSYNLEYRKGNIVDPEFPKVEIKVNKTDKKVEAKRLENKLTPEVIDKAVSKREEHYELENNGQCPYGEKCPYLSRGMLCLHNKAFVKIARMFKTRDLGLIEEGLSQLIESEAIRYETGLKLEEQSGMLSPAVTDIGDKLYKKIFEFITLVRPKLSEGTTFNIFNQQVNIGLTVKNLEEAGLDNEQRNDLAAKIGDIITSEKIRRAGGTPVATTPSGVSGEAG